jgi:general secretion pathway protein H
MASGRAGFTLLETLVVVTIIALVAIVAMPLLNRPAEGLRLRAAAREIVGALRVTRAAAITRNAELRLVIDVERRTFESPAIGRKSFSQDIAARLTIAAPERLGSSGGGFLFFADGSSTGGDLVLALGGREARICVKWLTGEAREDDACRGNALAGHAATGLGRSP